MSAQASMRFIKAFVKEHYRHLKDKTVRVRAHNTRTKAKGQWVRDYTSYANHHNEGVQPGRFEHKDISADIYKTADPYWRVVGFDTPSYDWKNEVQVGGTPAYRAVYGRWVPNSGATILTQKHPLSNQGLYDTLVELKRLHDNAAEEYHKGTRGLYVKFK